MRQKLLLVFITGAVLICSVSCDNPSGFVAGAKHAYSRVRQQAIKNILSANLDDQTKLRFLQAFVDTGMSIQDVDASLGAASSVFGHGPGFSKRSYDVGLTVSFYPDGETYAIAYRGPDGKHITLKFDEPVTWPKTKKP